MVTDRLAKGILKNLIELTALAGLDHAVTLAIVYPAKMKVMRKEKEAKILQYTERV